MESIGRNRIRIGTGLVLVLCFIMAGHGICDSLKSRTVILRSGDLFPPISFPDVLKVEERRYLGAEEKPLRSVAEIEAEVLVVKFLNSNCVYCIKSLPVFDEIFQQLEEDPGLRKKIKILGISAGDTTGEVATYKERYKVPYPIFPDPEFKAHKAVHEPTVPFIVITKRDREGKWVVASTHVGLTFSAESFVGELKAILEIDPNTLKKN
jgi:thiol-disulfide isomerase/thioredoxin